MSRDSALRRYVAQNKARLAGVTVISLVSAGLGLIQPLLLQQLFDVLTVGGVPAGIVIALTVVVIAQAASTGIEAYVLTTTAHGFVLGLRSRLADKIARLPILRLQETSHGEFLSRLVSDTAAASAILTTGVFKLIAAAVTFVVAAVLMALIDPTLFLVSLCITVVATVLSTVMGRLVRRASARTQTAMAAFASIFERVLAALPLIRAYGVIEKQLDLVHTEARTVRDRAVAVAKLGAYMQPVMTLATQALLLATLTIGGYRVSQGTLTVGALIAFMMYLLMMVGPVSQAGSTFVSIQSGLAAMDRVDDVLSRTEEHEHSPRSRGNSSQGPDRTLLKFEAVIFRYPESGNQPATIGPWHLEIREGEHIAVVGSSGSGKSTLFALLERFYTPDSGTILFRGHPITQLELDHYRSSIAWVPQSSPPIGGTVRDNLDIEQRGIPDAALRQALTDVGLLTDQGLSVLDRQITTQGTGLSGGERQRLGIARALLSGRPILLLDEPTSSLDSISAAALTTLLRDRAAQKTIVMASHRLADITHFDQIVVLDRGQLIGTGTHDELLRSCALYQELAAKQGMRVPIPS